MSVLLIDLLGHAAEVFPVILLVDFARYALAAGGLWLGAHGLLAGALSGRRIRPEGPAPGQIRREIASSLRTVVIFATVGLTIVTGAGLGILDVYDDPGERGWAWFAASTAILIVGHDAWFYWVHRAMHDPRLFRRFHALHHKSVVPTPFAAYAFDIGEAFLMAVYLPLVLLVMPASGLALFLFTTHMIVRNVMGHCGYELFPARADGRPLFGWLTTTTHHALHHRYAGSNLGLYFTWWDRAMGTQNPRYHAEFARAVRRPLLAQEGQAPRRGTAGLMVCLLTVSALMASEARGQDAALSAVAGQWASEGYGVVVEMAPCADGASLCGDLVWAWDEADLKPGMVGRRILSDFVFGDGVWTGGTLLNPEDGRTYRGTIRQRTNDLLDLKGCAGPFCQTETWRRLDSLPHVAGRKDGG